MLKAPTFRRACASRIGCSVSPGIVVARDGAYRYAVSGWVMGVVTPGQATGCAPSIPCTEPQPVPSLWWHQLTPPHPQDTANTHQLIHTTHQCAFLVVGDVPIALQIKTLAVRTQWPGHSASRAPGPSGPCMPVDRGFTAARAGACTHPDPDTLNLTPCDLCYLPDRGMHTP